MGWRNAELQPWEKAEEAREWAASAADRARITYAQGEDTSVYEVSVDISDVDFGEVNNLHLLNTAETEIKRMT